MKALTVTYSRLKSSGYPNFTNETFGITLQVEPGERADDVLRRAQEWVARKHGETTDDIPF